MRIFLSGEANIKVFCDTLIIGTEKIWHENVTTEFRKAKNRKERGPKIDNKKYYFFSFARNKDENIFEAELVSSNKPALLAERSKLKRRVFIYR